jgi:NADPH-dependent 7-cyano-7-deazaguanine reductase QueF
MDHQLENLGPERFQHLCQALLVQEFPGTNCLPVGQPDGGRDAVRYASDEANPSAFTVCQVKYCRDGTGGGDLRK